MRLLVSLFSIFVILVLPARAEDDHPRPFTQNYAAMADVDAALAEARETDKRLLLVLGANWCHDSRGLAHHFEDEEVASILERFYVVRYVDVGWRDRNHDVMRRFDVAAIYATPTVFIIDPDTETLLNRHERNAWTSAASETVSEARTYFGRWALQYTPSGGLVEGSLVYQALMLEIDLYEEEEATRLGQAYLDIGRWRELDRDERPENFSELEQEVESWRRRIPRDVASLRSDARRRVVSALSNMAGDEAFTGDTIAAFDESDPDIYLDMPRHQSDVW